MKVTATVHQFHLGKESADTMNRLGRTEAYKIDPRCLAYDNAHHDEFQPEFWKYYEKQGEVVVDLDMNRHMGILDDIFAAGNDGGYGPLAGPYNRYSTAYSISVGDIIIIGEMAWVVADFGFTQVQLPH